MQAPLSRFGDTASNAFALAALADVPLPVAVKTAGASLLAGAFRIALVPVDTLKTMMQVEGAQGVAVLRAKVAAHGPGALFHGALASASATVAGHWVRGVGGWGWRGGRGGRGAKGQAWAAPHAGRRRAHRLPMRRKRAG